MPTQSRTIRHLIQGGVASAFGPTAQVGVGQDNTVRFPFMADVRNMEFLLDGGARIVGGTDKLSAELESGSKIRGLYDYWRQASGSPVQSRICHVGTKIYADDGAGSFSEIESGLSSTSIPHYETFEDLLIISSDVAGEVPRKYNGTSVSTLGTNTPDFAFSATHKNRLWAAGVDSNGSRLYFSADLSSGGADGDWNDASAGNIDIDPDDGDRIMAIVSYKNELLVFKGPYKGAIHRITGSSPTGDDAFARRTFVEGLGAAGPNCIFTYRDDLGFLTPDGSIRSLNATASFGDYNLSSLTADIEEGFLNDRLTHDALKKSWIAVDETRGQIWAAVPIDSGNDPNFILLLDYRFNPIRISFIDAFDSVSLARVLDSSDDDRPRIMLGGSDGFVRRTQLPNISIDGTSGIAGKLTFASIDYGEQHILKHLQRVGVGIQPKGDFNATFSFARDDNPKQSLTFSQQGGDVLGPADDNEFTLGTSTLAGSMFANRFIKVNEGGQFRTIQYEFSHTGVNEGMEIHNFSAVLDIGTMSSEN